MSYHIISYNIGSYHIISYHIIQYGMEHLTFRVLPHGLGAGPRHAIERDRAVVLETAKTQYGTCLYGIVWNVSQIYGMHVSKMILVLIVRNIYNI